MDPQLLRLTEARQFVFSAHALRSILDLLSSCRAQRHRQRGRLLSSFSSSLISPSRFKPSSRSLPTVARPIPQLDLRRAALWVSMATEEWMLRPLGCVEAGGAPSSSGQSCQLTLAQITDRHRAFYRRRRKASLKPGLRDYPAFLRGPSRKIRLLIYFPKAKCVRIRLHIPNLKF